MDKLGLVSTASLHQLKRKYPHAFVIVQHGKGKRTVTLYDKQALDKFVAIREALKQRGQP
jgi:hypothetical protein